MLHRQSATSSRAPASFLSSSATDWARIASRFDDELARYHTALDYARECGDWAASRAARRDLNPQDEEPGPEFTVMGPGGGVLYIRERSHLLKFLSMYALERDPPAISETLNGCTFFRAYLDLDFKSAPGAGQVDADFKRKLVRLCIRAIARFYPAGARADAICVSRPTKFSVSADRPTIASDGIHIIWPYIVVSIREMAYMVVAMKHAVASLMGERDAGPLTNSWDGVFDMQVYRNGLRILGSCKRTPCSSCAKIRERGDDAVREVASRAFGVAYYRAMAEDGDPARATRDAQQAADAAKAELIQRAVGEQRAAARGSAVGAAPHDISGGILASQGARTKRFVHSRGLSCGACHGSGQITDKCPYEIDFYMDADESVNEQETLKYKNSKIDAILITRIRQVGATECSPEWVRPHDCAPVDVQQPAGGRASAAKAKSSRMTGLVHRADARYAIVQQLVQSYDRRFARVRVDAMYLVHNEELGEFTTSRRVAGQDSWAMHVHVSGPGSGTCMNLKRKDPHSTTKVYFVVFQDGLVQKCSNSSVKLDRIRNPCRKFSGPLVRLPIEVLDQLLSKHAVPATAATVTLSDHRLYGSKRLRVPAVRPPDAPTVSAQDTSDGMLSRTSTFSNDSDQMGADLIKHTTPTPVRVRLVSQLASARA